LYSPRRCDGDSTLSTTMRTPGARPSAPAPRSTLASWPRPGRSSTQPPAAARRLAGAGEIFDHPAGSLEEAAGARVEAAWRERRLSAGYDRPLLLMAALRAEAQRVAGAGPQRLRHPLFEAIAATAVRPE